MPEAHGRLVMTGASGTVGSYLTPRVSPLFAQTIAIGRTRPPHLRPADDFIPTDLASATALEQAASRLPGTVHAVLLLAGLDTRAGLKALTPHEFQHCLMVNCYAGLRLLAASNPPDTDQPQAVVIASSDVIGDGQPETALYALSKAALEEGLRHAVAETPRRSALFLRLPDLGIPMTRTDGTRPRPLTATPPTSPGPVNELATEHPALAVAAQHVTSFLSVPPEPGTVEVIEMTKVIEHG